MKSWGDEYYTKKAKKEKFVARSVYKLEEIDHKARVVKSSKLILDLGAAPGSWIQYCLKESKAEIVAIDLQSIDVSNPRINKIVGDIFELNLEEILQGREPDLVLSDMAPSTTGNAHLDVARSEALCDKVLQIARAHLAQGGHVIMKVFMGAGFEELRAAMRTMFTKVIIVRPKSTRQKSRELFLVGQGIKK